MQHRSPIPLLIAGKLALLIALALPPIGSAQMPVAHPDLTTAVATFQRASHGDTAAIAPALRDFTALSAARPGDPLTLAYAGAATSMQARTTWLPWKKLGHAEDGLAMIDKALALLTPAHDAVSARGVPVALETKLTAAGTFLALPAMFNRGERGRRLLDEVMQHPAFRATPAPFQDSARQIAAKAAS
ncbi:hypothetical protein [Sphaerotilus sp.]|uniref:hypothetical protein n=1 Tax=Sphaerotilus sp. TaxID=2093942 RepID=UPI002ACE49C3|nr:hypothetical protein [Sphaerotilus sp.]MDZ7855346.1 hypothetical protein [Sphaerotilus sp.]